MRRLPLVSLWAGFPGGEVVVQGLPGFSSIEAAGKTEARELSGGPSSTTRVARWSPRLAGTGSSCGKVAAVWLATDKNRAY